LSFGVIPAHHLLFLYEVCQHKKKLGFYPGCKDKGIKLQGIMRARKCDKKNMRSNDKTVSRAYGGALSANAVRERILRAFLVEEQKCVMQLVATKAQIEKKKPQGKKK